jgi:hypothetical protein
MLKMAEGGLPLKPAKTFDMPDNCSGMLLFLKKDFLSELGRDDENYFTKKNKEGLEKTPRYT